MSDEIDYNDDENPVWNRQDWDTDASFAAFQFYLIQTNSKRSVNKAWRVYARTLPPRTATQSEDGEPIPNRSQADPPERSSKAPIWFQRWSRAENSKGEPIDGAIGWPKRVQAYENALSAHVFHQQSERASRVAENALAVVEASMMRLAGALAKYEPSGEENIGELASATTKIVNLAGQVFEKAGIASNQMEITINDPQQAESARSDRSEKLSSSLTINDKMDRMAELLLLAEKRKKAEEAEEAGSDQPSSDD